MLNYVMVFYYLNNLLRRAYLSDEKLEEYQNRRFRSIMKYAYSFVPFYHKKFRELHLKPFDFKTLNDLKKFPIIQKNEMRKNLNEMVSKEFNIKELKMLSTSGSTGKPFFFYVNPTEHAFRKAKHLRANISCGQKPRDRWVNITAPHHFGEITKFQRILGVYTPTPVSVFNDVPKQIAIISEMKPDILDGYSSAHLLLAKELNRGEKKKIKPKFVLGGSELIDSYSRKFIENVLNVPFYDQYSSVEFDRIAWQCPMREGYHMDSDDMIIQFVDKNGEEVAPGERGEIVCTSLFSHSMPFIRYTTGDVGVPSDELCSCGRRLPLMNVVEGRKDSLLVLPDGRTLTPRTLTIAMNMFKFYRFINQFRIVQKELDLFEFFIEMEEHATEEAVIEVALVDHLKGILRVGDDVQFRIRFVDHIPLDKTGKLKAVSSEIKPDFFASIES